MNVIDSITHTVIRTALRISFKAPSVLPLPLPILRLGLDFGAKIFRPKYRAICDKVTLAGIPSIRLAPSGTTSTVVLHLHGGGFFAGSTRSHYALASDIAIRSNSIVYVINYRLAPIHTYPAALEDCIAAYKDLLAQGYKAENIIVGGDSAGCNLALSLAIWLRDNEIAMPSGIFMISPFINLTLAEPSVKLNKFIDPMITAKVLQRGADAYRGSIPATDQRVSPIYANLDNLPPLLIQSGKTEIIVDDARSLASKASQAGVNVECQLYEKMWHNFQMFNRLSHVAENALDKLAAFIINTQAFDEHSTHDKHSTHDEHNTHDKHSTHQPSQPSQSTLKRKKKQTA